MTVLNDYFKEMAKRANQKRVFIRAKKKGEKLHYIGYVSNAQSDLYHRTLITSWLLRFGGYEEIRYYNPKTKKCVGIWNLEKHNNYCREHHYNDTVWKDSDYVTLVEKKKEIYTGRFRQKVEETKREENEGETLREYLDRIHVDSGSDAGFVIQEIGKNTEMQVSRRYLECAAWEHLLDKRIVDFETVTTIYGQETIKLYLE